MMQEPSFETLGSLAVCLRICLLRCQSFFTASPMRQNGISENNRIYSTFKWADISAHWFLFSSFWVRLKKKGPSLLLNIAQAPRKKWFALVWQFLRSVDGSLRPFCARFGYAFLCQNVIMLDSDHGPCLTSLHELRKSASESLKSATTGNWAFICVTNEGPGLNLFGDFLITFDHVYSLLAKISVEKSIAGFGKCCNLNVGPNNGPSKQIRFHHTDCGRLGVAWVDSCRIQVTNRRTVNF